MNRGFAHPKFFCSTSYGGIGGDDIIGKLHNSFFYIILHRQIHTPRLFVRTIYAQKTELSPMIWHRIKKKKGKKSLTNPYSNSNIIAA